MRLETAALHWLMYVKKCHYAVRERSPRNGWMWEPDALGVMKNRKLIEVEIKRSMADFRQNASKHTIRNRAVFLDKFPYEFWFLVPLPLVAKAKKELPEYAGLLSPNESDRYPLTVEVQAPRNNESKRLTVKECVKLARCLANHVCALEKRWDMANEHRDHVLTYLTPMEYEI